MTGLEPASYWFAISRLTVQHTPTFLGGDCGSRTHSPYHYDDRLAICCITILPNLHVWRKAEESNPIPFLRTWFSRPVAGPSPLHYFPYRNILILHTFSDMTPRSCFTEPASSLECFYMAPEIRIELILLESKSSVLPLHYSGTYVLTLQIFKEQCVLYARYNDLSTHVLY